MRKNRKIGFEFKETEDVDSFKIVKQKGTYSQSTELFKIPWIAKTALLKELGRFKPIRDGKLWVITLMPVFEYSTTREKANLIKEEYKGIYRYLDNGSIVYIGKGNIRSRLREQQRNDWKFDTIEYSLIEDADTQFEWEVFWLKRFKSENEDFLPAYNLISGRI